VHDAVDVSNLNVLELRDAERECDAECDSERDGSREREAHRPRGSAERCGALHQSRHGDGEEARLRP